MNAAVQKSIDFTEGALRKKLLLFVLPILAGTVLQQLYVTADAVIIGKYTGKIGLAAIDSVYALIRLPVLFFAGISAGASIIVSYSYGAKTLKSSALPFIQRFYLPLQGELLYRRRASSALLIF